MLLPLNISQGIANTLGYLQYHLQKVMERQHVSESNINTTLVALTAQLQQLTQLVANPFWQYRTHLSHLYRFLQCFHPPLQRQNEHVLSSPLLQTLAKNVIMAVHS